MSQGNFPNESPIPPVAPMPQHTWDQSMHHHQAAPVEFIPRAEADRRFDAIDDEIKGVKSEVVGVRSDIAGLGRQMAATTATKNTMPLGLLAGLASLLIAFGGIVGTLVIVPMRDGMGDIAHHLSEHEDSAGHTAAIVEQAKNEVRTEMYALMFADLRAEDERATEWNRRQNDRQQELIQKAEHIVPREEFENRMREMDGRMDEDERILAEIRRIAEDMRAEQLRRTERVYGGGE